MIDIVIHTTSLSALTLRLTTSLFIRNTILRIPAFFRGLGVSLPDISVPGQTFPLLQAFTITFFISMCITGLTSRFSLGLATILDLNQSGAVRGLPLCDSCWFVRDDPCSRSFLFSNNNDVRLPIGEIFHKG